MLVEVLVERPFCSDLDRPQPWCDLDLAGLHTDAEELGQLAAAADLGHDRPRAAPRRQQPQRGGKGRAADATLAEDEDETPAEQPGRGRVIDHCLRC